VRKALLLEKLLLSLPEIYDKKSISSYLDETFLVESLSLESLGKLSIRDLRLIEKQFLPRKPKHWDSASFTFIDLFAGIGGLRSAFEGIGGKCVFTSEWNKYSQKTYKANWYTGEGHIFNNDIRDVTLSSSKVSENEAYKHIDLSIPDHDVLLAGFPCQPFSLAGVSKKNSLGRSHGFECEVQGTLFFDVARILKAKQPPFFLLENVKNLKSHDGGKTFRVILDTLDELGYEVAHAKDTGPKDPKIIDAKNFLPQHRERIVLVGFRKDIGINDFSLQRVSKYFRRGHIALFDLIDDRVDEKYTLSPKLWSYLYDYAKKHKAKGNGFGFGLFDPMDSNAVTRTLSARYHKDGSEILIDHKKWNSKVAEKNFWDEKNQTKRPRRLTPRECARLMGFEKPHEEKFRIPVSDTQAYQQFGNSVVVPVFDAVAKLMKPHILDTSSK